jgi:hypothetical protein
MINIKINRNTVIFVKKMPFMDRQDDGTCHDDSISTYFLVGLFKLVSASQNIFLSMELFLFFSFFLSFVGWLVINSSLFRIVRGDGANGALSSHAGYQWAQN